MAKTFDAILKGMLEWAPGDWAALAGFPARSVTVVDADVSTVTAASDKVLRVEDDPPWLLDVNFQSGPDVSVPDRAHLYSALLTHRHHLLVRSLVVLLTPRANLLTINGVLTRQFPNEPPYDTFRYDVARVWQLPPDPLLAGGLSTLPLAPISAVTEGQLPGVITRMKERLAPIRETAEAHDVWAASYILAGTRYERALLDQLFEGVIMLEESVTYQAIIEKGFARGEVSEARKNLFQLGKKRFGEAPPVVVAAIDSIHDVARLEDLLIRLLDVNSWQELLASPN